jgi:hypothetical protein
MTAGILTDVEFRQGQAKGCDAPAQVSQPALGNHALPGGVQRFCAELQRLFELPRIEVDVVGGRDLMIQ